MVNPFNAATSVPSEKSSDSESTTVESVSTTDSSSATVDSTNYSNTKVVEEKPKLEPLDVTSKDSILKHVQAILAEHGNLESNVPHGHAYWDLLNKFRIAK